MKRFLIVFMIGLLAAGSLFLTGCGNKNEADAAGGSETQSAQTDDGAADSQKDEDGASNNTSADLGIEETVEKLHFYYSSDANIKDSANGKIVENADYNVIVSHQKDQTSDELAESRGMSFVNAAEINGAEWKTYEYSSEQVSSVIYMCERDNGTYVVTISHDVGLDIDLEEETAVFMNNISFE